MNDQTRATGAAGSATGPFARLGAELDNLVRAAVPSDQACEHFTNARVEFLKGVRAVLDARIERLQNEPRRGVKIKVE